MIRRRRLAAVITLGALALGGLAACRADPDAAAYVGAVKISNEQVAEVVTALRERVASDVDQRVEQAVQAGELSAEELPETRDEWLAEEMAQLQNDTVMALVLNEVGRQYADANEIEIPQPAPAGVADQLQLEMDHPYVVLAAEYFAVVNAFQQQVEPVEPTEADQREAYDNARYGGYPPADTFEEMRGSLGIDAIGPQVGLRNLVREAVAEADVVINPRYSPVYRVPIQLVQAQSSLAVPLDPTDPAVVDDEPVVEADPAAADPQG